MIPSPLAPPLTEQTARDLREAARLVIKHGYTRGTYVDPDSGALCAFGALGVATNLLRIGRSMGRFYIDGFCGSPAGAAEERAYAVARAVAPLLPTCHGTDGTSAMNTIIHFNDVHCAGGPELAALFIEAAEKVEANLP
jgi:hypothetical protein